MLQSNIYVTKKICIPTWSYVLYFSLEKSTLCGVAVAGEHETAKRQSR